MAEPSRRRLIVEALAARLAAIDGTGEFETNAGTALFVGVAPELGPDEPEEAIALLIGDDQPTKAGPGFLISLPLNVCALAKADQDDAWTRIEQVLADIKRAVELEDRTLGRLTQGYIERGITRVIQREPGSLTVGVVVPYTAQYKEGWGAP